MNNFVNTSNPLMHFEVYFCKQNLKYYYMNYLLQIKGIINKTNNNILNQYTGKIRGIRTNPTIYHLSKSIHLFSSYKGTKKWTDIRIYTK